MPNKYVHVDGVATFLHHRGPTTLPGTPPDLRRGVPVLCVHAAGMNGATFASLLDALEPDHSPMAFDLPGHARSGSLDGLPSIEAMAGFVGSLLDALGGPRAILVGQSMGGMVALRCALDAPERVLGLVLVGTGAHVAMGDAQIDQLRLITEGKARRDLMPRGFSPQTKPDVIRQSVMERIKTDPRVELADVRAVRDFDVRSRLGEISVPTRVLVGADAAPEAKADANTLAQGIPGAEQIEVPDAGHALPMERPDALAEAVRGLAAEVA